MNLQRSILFLLVSWLMAFSCIHAAEDSNPGQNKFGLGGRYHADHAFFPELPFGDGDISYGLAYEWHDKAGYWQIALDYAPDVTGTNAVGTNAVDYVLTPQLNLVFQDGIWQGGAGILGSYIEDSVSGGDWTDVYWQLLLGIQLPAFSAVEINVHASYVFDRWKKLKEFEFDDLEYVLWLTFNF